MAQLLSHKIDLFAMSKNLEKKFHFNKKLNNLKLFVKDEPLIQTFWLPGSVCCWGYEQHLTGPQESILGPVWSEAPGSGAPCWSLLPWPHLEPSGVLAAQTEVPHALPHTWRGKSEEKAETKVWIPRIMSNIMLIMLIIWQYLTHGTFKPKMHKDKTLDTFHTYLSNSDIYEFSKLCHTKFWTEMHKLGEAVKMCLYLYCLLFKASLDVINLQLLLFVFSWQSLLMNLQLLHLLQDPSR